MAAKIKTSDLEVLLGEIREQLAALAERVARLEVSAAPAAASLAEPAGAAPAAVETPAGPEQISEEELLAISAAVAAYLGVRVRVRQVRLISSPAWAQQGRVSIQASHKLF
jgi:methylmalonyl-CoA carboxyltransferase large subunit